MCPICQEELKYQWHEETEEFVFMDAKQIGGRIFHASCHAEASKDKAAGTPRSRAGTPDVGAGGVKRKADVSNSLVIYSNLLCCYCSVLMHITGCRYQP